MPPKTTVSWSAALIVPLILSLFLSLGGCTLNEGDPQVTLCQKLAEQLSGNAKLNWEQADKQKQADKSMRVLLTTSMDNAVRLNAECIYLSDADDAGKDYDVNILDGYQNLPSLMTLDGKRVAERELHIAIQQVTGQSIKDTWRKIEGR